MRGVSSFSLNRQQLRPVSSISVRTCALSPSTHAMPKPDPFTELGLDDEVRKEAGAVRVRQHVNPLTRELQVPVQPLPWAEVFEDPTLPLVVDIGCGYGRFLLLLAKRERAAGIRRNYLGMEIRRPIIERANKWGELIGLGKTCHFVAANATVSYESCLSTYPGPIELSCVQFPDPHFKSRHRKRRIVQPGLVEQIARITKPGSHVFLQSDVCSVSVAMRDQFEEFGAGKFVLDEAHDQAGATFVADPDLELESRWIMSEAVKQQISAASEAAAAAPSKEEGEEEDEFVSTWRNKGWLVDNPLKAPTEREVYTYNEQKFYGKAFRVLLKRV